MAHHILLIDDEPDVRRIASLSLERLGGHHVCAVGCAADGLTLASADPPELILLDVAMPEMDGPSTFEALRGSAVTAGIPIVFMTSTAHPGEIQQLIELGALGVIQKPFDPVTLPAQLEELIAGAPVERDGR